MFPSPNSESLKIPVSPFLKLISIQSIPCKLKTHSEKFKEESHRHLIKSPFRPDDCDPNLWTANHPPESMFSGNEQLPTTYLHSRTSLLKTNELQLITMANLRLLLRSVTENKWPYAIRDLFQCKRGVNLDRCTVKSK